ncbi:valine--tRNA ligase, partial [Gammaproteobacteria bacterium 54_18_T64]
DDNAPDALKKGTRRTLIRVLESIMRLAHPMMPFITEEVWQKIHTLAGKQGDTIMLQPFPIPDDSQRDTAAAADIEWIKQIIIGVRNIRGEINISPGKLLPVLLQNGNAEDQRRLEENAPYLTKLANLESVQWLDAGATAPPSATALVGEMEIFVPMAGIIDKEAELARLDKEIGKLKKELGRLKGKLSNDKFTANAPDDVVAKERQKLSDAESALSRLEEQKEKILAL